MLLAECPIRLKHRRVVALLGEGFVLVPVSVKIEKEFRLVPAGIAFDTSETPFPQGGLGRETAKHDGHLQCHEHAEEAQDNDQQCEYQCQGLPGEKKPDGCDKNRIGREIVRQEAVVIPDARCPQIEEMERFSEAVISRSNVRALAA